MNAAGEDRKGKEYRGVTRLFRAYEADIKKEGPLVERRRADAELRERIG